MKNKILFFTFLAVLLCLFCYSVLTTTKTFAIKDTLGEEREQLCGAFSLERIEEQNSAPSQLDQSTNPTVNLQAQVTWYNAGGAFLNMPVQALLYGPSTGPCGAFIASPLKASGSSTTLTIDPGATVSTGLLSLSASFTDSQCGCYQFHLDNPTSPGCVAAGKIFEVVGCTGYTPVVGTPTSTPCMYLSPVLIGFTNATSTPTPTITEVVTSTPTSTPLIGICGELYGSRIGAQYIAFQVANTIEWSIDATTTVEGGNAPVVADVGKSGDLKLPPDVLEGAEYWADLGLGTPVVTPSFENITSLDGLYTYTGASDVTVGGTYGGVGTLFVDGHNVTVVSNIAFTNTTTRNAFALIVRNGNVSIASSVTSLQHTFIYTTGTLTTGESSTQGLLMYGILASASNLELERCSAGGSDEQLYYDWGALVFCPPGVCYTKGFRIIRWQEVPAL